MYSPNHIFSKIQKSLLTQLMNVTIMMLMTLVLPVSRILQITTLFLFLMLTSAAAAFASDNDYHIHATPGTHAGTVQLTWENRDYIDDYNIMYGEAPGSYQYGALNVGNVGSYSIGSLVPGKTYYFAIVPIDDGRAEGQSLEAAGTAAGGTTHSTTTTDTTTQPVHQQTTYTPPPAQNDDNLTAVTGSESGIVQLHWEIKEHNIDNFNIFYGPNEGNYLWSVVGTGRVDSYTISGLTPGQTYVFGLSRVYDDEARAISSTAPAIAR